MLSTRDSSSTRCHPFIAHTGRRFLLMRLAGQEPPRGVALSEVLLTLADTARAQGALKLARYCYSRLQVPMHNLQWHGVLGMHRDSSARWST